MAEESIASERAASIQTTAPPLRQLRYLLKSMRPRQWTKNGIVFMAFIFSVGREWRIGDLSTWDHMLVACVLTAIAFSLVSGAEYLVNDTKDRVSDSLHPTKRRRPIAAGLVAPQTAIMAAALAAGAGIALAYAVDWRTGVLVTLYMALMLLYTYVLKYEVILDVMTISAGFVLRAIAGAYAIDVPVSPWLYVVTALGALFLGITKRRAEVNLLQEDAGNHRSTLQHYSPALLDQMTAMVTASTVIAYALYTFTAEYLPENHAMMLTIPFVAYGLFRYLYLTLSRNEGGSPEEVLLRDVPLIITILGWVVTSMIILTASR